MTPCIDKDSAALLYARRFWHHVVFFDVPICTRTCSLLATCVTKSYLRSALANAENDQGRVQRGEQTPSYYHAYDHIAPNLPASRLTTSPIPNLLMSNHDESLLAATERLPSHLGPRRAPLSHTPPTRGDSSEPTRGATADLRTRNHPQTSPRRPRRHRTAPSQR